MIYSKETATKVAETGVAIMDDTLHAFERIGEDIKKFEAKKAVWESVVERLDNGISNAALVFDYKAYLTVKKILMYSQRLLSAASEQPSYPAIIIHRPWNHKETVFDYISETFELAIKVYHDNDIKDPCIDIVIEGMYILEENEIHRNQLKQALDSYGVKYNLYHIR